MNLVRGYQSNGLKPIGSVAKDEGGAKHSTIYKLAPIIL